MTNTSELDKFYKECKSLIDERYYDMQGPGCGYSADYLSFLAREIVKTEIDELAMTPHPRIVSEADIENGIRETQYSASCDASIRAISQLMDMGVIVECAELPKDA